MTVSKLQGFGVTTSSLIDNEEFSFFKLMKLNQTWLNVLSVTANDADNASLDQSFRFRVKFASDLEIALNVC
jgi:hypothetical protein